MECFRFEVRQSWNGGPLRRNEFARIELRIGAPGGGALEVEIEATDYGDPAPATCPGRCDGLWNFEVVELFLLGDGDRYLELEFGPHGHFLALTLEGRRRIVPSDLAVEFTAERRGPRWHGRARVPLGGLPPGLRAANAYAIHGEGEARRYLAWAPVPGAQPDFHRLECFPALARAQRPSQCDDDLRTG